MERVKIADPQGNQYWVVPYFELGKKTYRISRVDGTGVQQSFHIYENEVRRRFENWVEV